MRAGMPVLAPLCLASVLFYACSFDYGMGIAAGEPYPDIVIEDARIDRYENSGVTMRVKATTLEMYDRDEVWAAGGANFEQYSASGQDAVKAEGSAGTFLIDNKAEVYSLGGPAIFHLIDDGMTIEALDLRWVRKTQRLSGPINGEVLLKKDDGSLLRGAGFFADTLSRSYSFGGAVSGALVSAGDGKE